MKVPIPLYGLFGCACVVLLYCTLVCTGHSSKELFGQNNKRELQKRTVMNDCEGFTQQTFSNMDYALLGYNIIKGYPLAYGQDPGFSDPIFDAHYLSKHTTADCHYKIPDGFMVLSDISCMTSFESTTIETTFELVSSLSSTLSIGIEPRIPFFAFKASAGYKRSTSSMSNGKYIYIVSNAKCCYYTSQLNTDSTPEFSSKFLHWIRLLNASNNRNLYMNFFDKFGTHFPTQLVFGAKYTFEHKMLSQTFKTEEEKGVNMEMSAKLSAQYSVRGGFSLDTSQRKEVTQFNENVSTRTITKGAAPPSNGDAMTWASTVKDSPVPIKYKLSSIFDLFTEKYMSSLNISYSNIWRNLNSFYPDYCPYLQQHGQVDSCEDHDRQLDLKSTQLWAHSSLQSANALGDCMTHCTELAKCFAVSYYRKKTECYLFSKDYYKIRGTFNTDWETVIFQQPRNEKISMRNQIGVFNIFNISILQAYEKELTLFDTAISGERQGGTPNANSLDECSTFCHGNRSCVAFSYRKDAEKKYPCKIFKQNRINHLYKEVGTKSTIKLNWLR